jgi:hypothetical protein
MRRKRRSMAMLLITLWTMTLFFAGCSAGHSPSGDRNAQTTTRLLLRATPTAPLTTGERGTYLGRTPNQNAWIGLSSTGKNFIAFVTDGTPNRPPTFAQWFRGPLSNNTASATATTRGGHARLQAILTSTQALGTIALADGRSIPFTANVLATTSVLPTPTSTPQQATPTSTSTPQENASPTPTSTPSASSPSAGLYRGERTINGAQYVAGWIVLPETMAGGTQTPTATPVTSTGQGTAILNEKTSAAQIAPALTAQELSSGAILVPTLGAFNLLACRPSSPC